MYRVRLICDGVPKDLGGAAAIDISREFREVRTWHEKTTCIWDGSNLILEVQNDFDDKGLATIDEFSDCLSAFITEGFDGDIKVESIVEL
jgi:hypothetical protein